MTGQATFQVDLELMAFAVADLEGGASERGRGAVRRRLRVPVLASLQLLRLHQDQAAALRLSGPLRRRPLLPLGLAPGRVRPSSSRGMTARSYFAIFSFGNFSECVLSPLQGKLHAIAVPYVAAAVGLTFYVSRYPERCCKAGSVDILGASHQVHIFSSF